MKKVFTLLSFLLIFCGAIGQTYDPTKGTVSNKPYAPATPVPTDARSFFYDATNFLWRRYQSTSEVLSFLSNPSNRSGNYPIYVCTGTLNGNGTFTGGQTFEYMFRNGVADSNLVLINIDGIIGTNNGITDSSGVAQLGGTLNKSISIFGDTSFSYNFGSAAQGYVIAKGKPIFLLSNDPSAFGLGALIGTTDLAGNLSGYSHYGQPYGKNQQHNWLSGGVQVVAYGGNEFMVNDTNGSPIAEFSPTRIQFPGLANTDATKVAAFASDGSLINISVPGGGSGNSIINQTDTVQHKGFNVSHAIGDTALFNAQITQHPGLGDTNYWYYGRGGDGVQGYGSYMGAGHRFQRYEEISAGDDFWEDHMAIDTQANQTWNYYNSWDYGFGIENFIVHGQVPRYRMNKNARLSGGDTAAFSIFADSAYTNYQLNSNVGSGQLGGGYYLYGQNQDYSAAPNADIVNQEFGYATRPQFVIDTNGNWESATLASTDTTLVVKIQNVSAQGATMGRLITSHIYPSTIGAEPALGYTPDKLADTVSTIALLEAYPTSKINVKSVIVTDSLRGGYFRWYPIALPDSGTVFPAWGLGSGYWVRVIEQKNRTNVLWFGAKGDGVSNDGAAFRLAISYIRTQGGGAVQIPYRNLGYIVDSMGIGTNINIEGVGGRPKITAAISTASGLFYLLDAPTEYSSIHNLDLVGNPSNTLQHGLNLTAFQQSSSPFTGGIWYSDFESLHINGFSGNGINLNCIDVSGDMANQFLTFKDVSVIAANSTSARALYSIGQLGQTAFINCEFDMPNSSFLLTSKNVDLETAVSGSDFPYSINFITSTFQNADSAVVINGNGGSIQFDNCHLENIRRSFTLRNSANVNIIACEFQNAAQGSLNGGTAGQGRIVFFPGSKVNFVNNQIKGTCDTVLDGSLNNQGWVESGTNYSSSSSIFPSNPNVFLQTAISSNSITTNSHKFVLVNTSLNPLQTINSQLGIGEVMTIRATGSGYVEINGLGNIKMPAINSSGTLLYTSDEDILLQNYGPYWMLLNNPQSFSRNGNFHISPVNISDSVYLSSLITSNTSSGNTTYVLPGSNGGNEINMYRYSGTGTLYYPWHLSAGATSAGIAANQFSIGTGSPSNIGAEASSPVVVLSRTTTAVDNQLFLNGQSGFVPGSYTMLVHASDSSVHQIAVTSLPTGNLQSVLNAGSTASTSTGNIMTFTGTTAGSSNYIGIEMDNDAGGKTVFGTVSSTFNSHPTMPVNSSFIQGYEGLDLIATNGQPIIFGDFTDSYGQFEGDGTLDLYDTTRIKNSIKLDSPYFIGATNSIGAQTKIFSFSPYFNSVNIGSNITATGSITGGGTVVGSSLAMSTNGTSLLGTTIQGSKTPLIGNNSTNRISIGTGKIFVDSANVSFPSITTSLSSNLSIVTYDSTIDNGAIFKTPISSLPTYFNNTFIQNQSSSAQTAKFWINGTGQMGRVLTDTIYSPSTNLKLASDQVTQYAVSNPQYQWQSVIGGGVPGTVQNYYFGYVNSQGTFKRNFLADTLNNIWVQGGIMATGDSYIGGNVILNGYTPSIAGGTLGGSVSLGGTPHNQAFIVIWQSPASPSSAGGTICTVTPTFANYAVSSPVVNVTAETGPTAALAILMYATANATGVTLNLAPGSIPANTTFTWYVSVSQ